jgi:hypothetical protein
MIGISAGRGIAYGVGILVTGDSASIVRAGEAEPGGEKTIKVSICTSYRHVNHLLIRTGVNQRDRSCDSTTRRSQANNDINSPVNILDDHSSKR